MPGDIPTQPGTGGLPDLPPVQHAGERVLTTELLARVYGVPPENLQANHQNNRDRFEEGVHFYRLTGEALRQFKNSPNAVGVVDKRTPSLVVWTERVAARHAKLVQTDAAWAIFGKLEESYFSTPAAEREVSAAPIVPSARSLRSIVADFKSLVSLGPLLGYDRNQSTLAANRATRKFHGVDLLDGMGVAVIEAPRQELQMTAGELGMRLGGLSAQATNKALTKHLFQTSCRDAKGDLHYEPTELGKLHSRMMDVETGNRGTSKQYLAWLTSVVELLKAAMDAQEPAA